MGKVMNTKDKILKVAAQEFARNGYKNTTVREICKRAKVNVAAIRYHFSGKKFLYKDVIDYLFSHDPSNKREIDITEISEEEWKGCFCNYISELIIKMTGKEEFRSALHKIIFREILDPSELFPVLYQEYLRLLIDNICRIISFRFHSELTDEAFDIVLFSIIAQISFYEENKNLVKQYYKCSDFLV